MQRDGERRQVTVLFCDLVDSTRLGARLDPEDLRDALRAYQACCADAARENGGFVAQYLGDGVIVYFGFPQACEDAAEQAVRTAQRILRSTARLETACGPLRARAGVATGLAVVGDVVGSGPSEHAAVTGQVANIAARLQAVAEAGTVVVADETRRLVQSAFECLDLGARALKGVDEPVRAWAVGAERDPAGRLERAKDTPGGMVGRGAELRAIMDHWTAACAGGVRAALVVGEAGIGKSRLLREAGREIELRGGKVAVLQGSPRHGDSPFFPVIACLRRLIGWTAHDGAAENLARLRRFLAAEGLAAAEQLLGALMSIPGGPERPGRRRSAEQERRDVFALLHAIVGRAADAAPLLLAVEDAQWMDRSTGELLDGLVRDAALGKVLVVATARTGYAPPWGTHPGVGRLELQRLPPEDARRLVAGIARDRMPRHVVEQILRRSDGVPLFLEEMSFAVLDGGAPDGAPRAHGIPVSLQDGLMARLDRLGSAKLTAQVAAVLGRTFSLDLLGGVMERPRDDVAGDLARLEAAGLVHRRAEEARGEYVFKHALVQEAAHESLLRRTRSVLHGKAAAMLEGAAPNVVESEPEVLADHWVQAGDHGRAAAYWLKAGRRALARAANAEAIGHLRRAEQSHLRAAEPRDGRLVEFGIQLGLGQASYVVNGPAHPETVAAYARAQDLIEAVADPDQRCRVLYGIFSGYHFASKFDLARRPALRMLDLAEQEGSARRLCQAYRMLGYIAFFRGELDAAERRFGQLARAYRREEHVAEAFEHGCDCLVGTQAFQAVVESVRGPHRRAVARARANLEYAASLDHPASVGWAYAASCYVHYFGGEPEAAEAASDAGMAYCEEHDVASWYAHCRLFRVWASPRLRGEPPNRAEQARATMELAGRGNKLGLPLFRAVIAEMHLADGRAAEAVAEAEAAVRAAVESGQRFFEPVTRLVRAECMSAASSSDPAVDRAFDDALAASFAMDARVIELRTARAMLARAEAEGARRALEARIDDLRGELEDDRGARVGLEVLEVAPSR